jgi:YHS domain-containing protein
MKVEQENLCTSYEGKHFCFCSEACLKHSRKLQNSMRGRRSRNIERA